MKAKIVILLLLLNYGVWGQGGPNGPPNPACSGPNPPPWCDTPGVPIDTPILMIGLLIGGILLGYRQYNETKVSNINQQI